jgi:predicted lactoylglutathione lyase
MIFVNLPIKDLKRSVQFYTKLGFMFDPRYTDEKATCMIVSENASYVMLVTEPFFSTFIEGRPSADTKKDVGAIIALSLGSKAEVDEMIAAAVEGGGEDFRRGDEDVMYSRAFTDPDGHIWEPFYMAPAATAA